jgi:hypothetical protein
VVREPADADKARMDHDALQARNWQWVGAEGATGPLADDAQHFTRPKSSMVFEPASNGGLAVPPEAALIHAGFVAVGHFCKFGSGGTRFMTFSRAARCMARRRARHGHAWWPPWSRAVSLR